MVLRPRRILFIESTANGVQGGSVLSLHDLVRGLDRERYEPIIVLYSNLAIRDELEKVCRVMIVEQGNRWRLSHGTPPRSKLATWKKLVFEVCHHVLPMTFVLVRIIRRERIDLVHTNNFLNFSLEGILAAKACGIPIIVHQRGIGKVSRLARILSRYVDVLICISDAVRDFSVMDKVPVKRMERVYNGIKLSRKAHSGSSNHIRAALGFSVEVPIIGIVGTIQEWKGQREVIQGVSRLIEQFPGIRCLIVGGVFDQAYEKEIRTLTQTLGLSENICFLGHREDVEDLMNAMDVVIHASLSPEPFGRVLIEAMALGKPLIASRAGGPLEIVETRVSGLLVPPGDVPALARAVSSLLKDKRLAVKMGEAGRQRVEGLFDLRNTVRSVERIYDSVLSAC